MAKSDEELWQSFRQGDNSAFTALVERYHRELFAFLSRYVNNAEQAEDLVQDTFLQIYRSQQTFDTSRALRPWLFTVAANKARDFLRLRQRRPDMYTTTPGRPEDGEFASTSLFDQFTSGEPTPEVDLESRETMAQVREVMAGMPENLKETLLLAYFHQFPYEEIGSILGVSSGTVKSRVHHALQWFAKRWREEQAKESRN